MILLYIIRLKYVLAKETQLLIINWVIEPLEKDVLSILRVIF